ncbi:MAG TPA: hypothetical protein VFQ65_05325, partial [Kofleriaceae bacterium]|nr:hypothetical protein [Kofleriaceae bacterium]
GLDVIVGPDDATANASSIATRAATLTSYLAADPQRGSKISGLVSEIAAKVAPFGVEIVTARPAAGPYHIVVITDDSNTAIDASGDPAVLSTTLLENPCNQVPSAISYVFGASNHNEVVEATIDMFANLNGVPESIGPHDCMCRVGLSCVSDVACTIGGPNTPVATLGNCGVTGTMDENAMFLKVFGPS